MQKVAKPSALMSDIMFTSGVFVETIPCILLSYNAWEGPKKWAIHLCYSTYLEPQGSWGKVLHMNNRSRRTGCSHTYIFLALSGYLATNVSAIASHDNFAKRVGFLKIWKALLDPLPLAINRLFTFSRPRPELEFNRKYGQNCLVSGNPTHWPLKGIWR